MTNVEWKWVLTILVLWAAATYSLLWLVLLLVIWRGSR
jgi:hypothetical protein